MLDLCQHEVLDVKLLNVLNDVASHWRNCQLEERKNGNIEGAHIRGTDKPESDGRFRRVLQTAICASWVGLKARR